MLMNLYFYLVYLGNDKYYVLLSENENFVLDDLYGNTALMEPMPDWLLINKPIKVLERIPYTGNFSLNDHVVLYMEKYGIDKVRGGTYIDVVLTFNQKKAIEENVDNVSRKYVQLKPKKKKEKKKRTFCQWFCNLFSCKSEHKQPLLSLDD